MWCCVRRLLHMTRTSLKGGVNEIIRHISVQSPWMRENLDTECIAFTMFNLWLGTIEPYITEKLNGNF